MKKFVVLVLLITLLGTCGILIKPKPARAFDFAQLARNIWDWAEAPITAALAAVYLNVVRPREMDWIAGTSDAPPWPADWGTYIWDVSSAFILEKISEDYLGGLNLCGDIPILLSLSLAPLAIPPARRKLVPPCTAREAWENIEEGIANLDDYVKIAEPQNNFFGGYLIASTELGRQVDEKQRNLLSQLIAGEGYLGIQKCEGEGAERECQIVSPGSLVSQKVGWGDQIPVKKIAEATTLSALFSGILMDQFDVATGGLINRLYRGVQKYGQEKK